MMLDVQEIERASLAVETALKAIDPIDRRKGLILSTAASIAFSLIVVFTLLVVVLRWRGFV